jgi:hypothetical protein
MAVTLVTLSKQGHLQSLGIQLNAQAVGRGRATGSHRSLQPRDDRSAHRELQDDARYTIVAALLDEIAFWPTDPDSADPDAEVVSAIKPSMATIPEGKKWILDNQVVPNQVGLGLVEELRSYLDGLPARQLADTLIGGLSTYDFPETHGGEMPMRRLRASLPLKRRWCQSSPRRLKGIIQIPRSWSS